MNNVSLDIIGRFNDPKLQEEYILSCLDQKSKFSFFFLTLLIVGWSIIETFARCRYTTDTSVYANETFGVLGLFSSISALICGILLSMYSSSSSAHKKDRTFQSNVQVCFIVLINLIFLVKIYALIDAKLCIPNGLHLLETLQGILSSKETSQTMIKVHAELLGLACPPSTSVSFVSLMQAVLMMSMTPQILVAILYEPRLYLVLSCHLFTGSLIVYVIYSDLNSIIALFSTLIILSVLLFELHYQRVQSFLNHRKLQEILRENERNADAVHAMEMRHMIGNVAHDLKTPLASFATGLDLITEIVLDLQKNVAPEYLANDAITDCIASLHSCLSSTRNTNAFMLMAINRCIDYTKASNGVKLVPMYATVDLREALQFPIECMSNIQERIGIKLEPLSEEICSHIITDKQWLQENLLCLLSNAVKYSVEGNVAISAFIVTLENHSSDVVNSTVKRLNGGCTDRKVGDIHDLSLDSEEVNLLRFEIEDFGIGVSEEAMKDLFNPFKQAQRLAGGTGLGLFSLAKRVEALKGSYGVLGRSDGKQGSLFWFGIPYRPDRTAEIAASHSSDTSDILAKLHPIPFAAETKLMGKLEILIVDDAPSILKMSSMLLKRQGHQIWTAENGEIALKRIEEKWKESGRGFDLVLMDLQMPVMDGLEATRRLRKMESEGRDWMFCKRQEDAESSFSSAIFSIQPSSPMVTVKPQLVFGVSANSDHDTMKEAVEAGVDDFLGKPFSIDLFNKSIQRSFK